MYLPSSLANRRVCSANSLVGDKTKALAPLLADLHFNFSNNGMRKQAVLPDPVLTGRIVKPRSWFKFENVLFKIGSMFIVQLGQVLFFNYTGNPVHANKEIIYGLKIFLAMATTSLLSRMSGMVLRWMGVGTLYPFFITPRNTSWDNPIA